MQSYLDDVNTPRDDDARDDFTPVLRGSTMKQEPRNRNPLMQSVKNLSKNQFHEPMHQSYSAK